MSDLEASFERPGTALALRRQNESLRQAIAVVDRLTALALEGADVPAITEELARSIAREVAVFDRLLRPIAAGRVVTEDGPTSPPERSISDPRLTVVLETARDRRLPLRIRALPDWGLDVDMVITPIVVGEQLLGYLVVTTGGDQRDDEDLELLTVQHAASIYGLALVESQRDAAVRSRHRAELVDSLLRGRFDEQNALELARLAGIGADLEHAVFAIAPAQRVGGESGAESPLLASLASDLDDVEPGVVALARLDHVVVIAPLVFADGTDSGSFIADMVRRRFPVVGFSIGASSPTASPTELGRAEVQSRRALAIAQRLGAVGEVTTHESLGVHRLLLHVPEDELRAFVDDILGELTSHDVAQQASLVETLAVYLRANGHLRRAAEELFVHVNTVSYRIRRIEAITGLDLASSDDRLLAQMAIESLRAVSDIVTGEPDPPLDLLSQLGSAGTSN